MNHIYVESADDFDVRPSRNKPSEFVIYRRTTGHAVEHPLRGLKLAYFISEDAARAAIPEWIALASEPRPKARRVANRAFVNPPARTLAQELSALRAYMAKRDIDPWHGWRPHKTGSNCACHATGFEWFRPVPCVFKSRERERKALAQRSDT